MQRISRRALAGAGCFESVDWARVIVTDKSKQMRRLIFLIAETPKCDCEMRKCELRIVNLSNKSNPQSGLQLITCDWLALFSFLENRTRNGKCGNGSRRFSGEGLCELNSSKKIGTGKMPENRKQVKISVRGIVHHYHEFCLQA